MRYLSGLKSRLPVARQSLARRTLTRQNLDQQLWAQQPRPQLSTAGLAIILMWVMCFAISGCSGGGSSVAQTTQVLPPVIQEDEQSKVFIGLTDATGDFLQYQVNVVSISLQRANGSVVETLPLATEFDFAQYTEVTEFFTAASVPVGRYNGMALTLDYTDSAVLVENENGEAVAVTVVDGAGLPVGQIDVALSFEDDDGFRILPGVPAHVTLDFDLESSHKVNLLADPAVAELDGVLIADTVLEEPKQRRARGILESVNQTANQFSLQLRPFYRATGRFGSILVHVADTTRYEIDGQMYQGADGLAALSTLPLDSPVVTTGELQISPRQYAAHLVFAGSSVPFGEKDVAIGTVMARVNNQLTLRGATLIREDSTVSRRETLTILVEDSTSVTQVASSLMEFDANDISVGQRIFVSGAVQTQDSSVDDASVVLDAADGRVRLLYTDVYGGAVAASPLALDLATINQFNVARFDFSGAAVGLDPNHYQIDTSNLQLPTLDIGDAVRVRGFVAPFGSSQQNFLAQSVSDSATLPGVTRVTWPIDAPAFVLSANDSAVVLDLAASTRAVHRFFGHIMVTLSVDGAPWTLQSRQTGRGVFTLAGRDSRQIFTQFDEFSAALLAQINTGNSILHIRSQDRLTVGTQISEVYKVSVFLKD